jgi:ring-1,2-phenylacetyl-CoA epoxidase subunit PaaE
MNTCVGFASGSGLAPALATVDRLLAGAPTNRVWLFYGHGGVAGSEAIPDGLEQLLALKDRHLSRLSLAVVMDREPDEAELLSGRLDAAKVRTLAAKLFQPASVDEYFVCGPETLVADVTKALGEVGVPAARIQVERAADERVLASVAATATRETQVSFVMDGRRRTFTMRTDEESILDAADRAGIELPYSCKAGVCATCRTKLVRGKVDLLENHALEDWELEQGFILACQARARTPEIELTYDEK